MSFKKQKQYNRLLGAENKIQTVMHLSCPTEIECLKSKSLKSHDQLMTADDLPLEFVKRINAHDVDGLVRLMTPDHIFVDSLGEKSTRPTIEQGWRQYFEMVPDYWVRVDRSFHDGDTTVLVGRAGGTYVRKGGLVRSRNRWETPAVWVARIRSDKVAEWHIYADNEPIRQKMRRKS